jgi:predicted DNA-binding protein
MNVKRVNYSIGKVTQQQLEDLKKKLGVGASDIVRRAVEKLWEEKMEK